MADARRTRWVAHDVYFLDDGLGAAMFERFGAAGVALWHGFIAACKKNHVEGEISFASVPEALTVFGLPGMPLVDGDGEPFELDDWFKLLSDHKVIRRTSRARRLKVACTKWTRWQQSARRSTKAEQEAARRAEVDEQSRRSNEEKPATIPARNGHGTATDLDTDTDPDTDPKSLGASANAGQLMAEHLEAYSERPPAAVVGQTAKLVKQLLSEGYSANHMREALELLRVKATHPATLPSLLNEVLNPRQLKAVGAEDRAKAW